MHWFSPCAGHLGALAGDVLQRRRLLFGTTRARLRMLLVARPWWPLLVGNRREWLVLWICQFLRLASVASDATGLGIISTQRI